MFNRPHLIYNTVLLNRGALIGCINESIDDIHMVVDNLMEDFDRVIFFPRVFFFLSRSSFSIDLSWSSRNVISATNVSGEQK